MYKHNIICRKNLCILGIFLGPVICFILLQSKPGKMISYHQFALFVGIEKETDNQAVGLDASMNITRNNEIIWGYGGATEKIGYLLCRNDKETAIIKMAMLFGENELALPEIFINDVLTQINLWRSSGEFTRIIKRARKHGYTTYIANALIKKGLPKEFFYLSMQESRFDKKAVGPNTRWGVAKGLWQFIPATAQRYNLKIGPLKNQRIFDPDDERHDVIKSTNAAIQYIQDISATKGSPSWLLVMASYNWGEQEILSRLERFPERSELTNFWKFYQEFKMPRETREYVLKVFAAAVIGENPKLFGITLKNPLLA